ncbi:MAG TPA: response regulator [Chloroflexota bacterium]
MTAERQPQRPPPELEDQIRDALIHLFDPSHLQTHPLLEHLSPQAAPAATRAKLLRRELLDAIEALRPEIGAPSDSRAVGTFRLLEMRYVEGLPVEDILGHLGLSKSEYYRRHRLAFAGLVSLLRERLRGLRTDENRDRRTSSPADLARLEIEQIRHEALSGVAGLRDVLTSVLTTLQPLCEQRGTRITMASPDDETPIWLDRMMARHASMIALTRALDLCLGGLITLVLGQDGDSATVAVRLTRGSSASTLPAGSPELGLENARQLIAALGGTFSFGCTNGGACELLLALPCARQPTILVIDNSPDFGELVARYVRPYGWEAVTALDAEQGMSTARILRPNVILLDVLMPDRDGWELLASLKADSGTRDVPVLVCSVLNEPQLASALGAAGWLPKPVSRAGLLRVLEPWRLTATAAGPAS